MIKYMANLFVPGVAGVIAAVEFTQDVCNAIDNINNIAETAKFFYDVFTPQSVSHSQQSVQFFAQQSIQNPVQLPNYNYGNLPKFVDHAPILSILNPKHPSHPSHPNNQFFPQFSLAVKPLPNYDTPLLPRVEPDGPKIQWLADHERNKFEWNFREMDNDNRRYMDSLRTKF